MPVKDGFKYHLVLCCVGKLNAGRRNSSLHSFDSGISTRLSILASNYRYEEQKIDVLTSLHSFSYFISKRKLVKPSSPRCLDYDIQYMINHFWKVSV